MTKDADREPKTGRQPLETILLLLTAGCLLVLSRPSLHVRLLNLLYPSPGWARHAAASSRLLVLAAVAALGLAVASYVSALRGASLSSRAVRALREGPGALRAGLVRGWQLCFPSVPKALALVAVLALGIWARAAFLSQPMRYDEAWAFLTWSNGSLADVFNYSSPNNHVLHTLLVRVSTFIWGAHPASIRVPAFLAGVASIPATFLLARSLLPWMAAFFASAAVAGMPYLILFSTNARGYTLVTLLVLCLALVCVHLARTPSGGGGVAFSAIAALGMLTTPTMLFAIAGAFCWLMAWLILEGRPLSRVLTEFVLPCALMTVSFTFLLYVPAIARNGLAALISNPYIVPQSWEEFFLITRTHRRLLGDFRRDIPAALRVALYVLIAAGIFLSARRRVWAIALLLPAVFLSAIAILLLHHVAPYTRHFTYVIPLGLITAAAGLADLTERLSPSIQTMVAVLILAGAAVFVAGLVSRNAIGHYDDTGSFPEADTIVKYLKPMLMGNDKIEARVPADWPVFFYAWYRGVPRENIQGGLGGRTFFVVKRSWYSIEQMTARPVTRILDLGDAAVYESAGGKEGSVH